MYDKTQKGGNALKRILAAALCLMLLLTGCGGELLYTPTGDALQNSQTTQSTAPPSVPTPQSLTLAYYPEKSMNPYEATELSHKLIFSLVYQGLFAVDDQYQVHPILCQSYRVSKDLKTYTFYPAEATFADGSPVTAGDIAASLKAAQKGAVYAGRLKQVDTITLTEDSGVAVSLKTPYENLPMLLDIPIVKAREVAAQTPMGTGPYCYDVGLSGLQLRRRADWWCQVKLPVTAETVSLLEVDSPATMRNDFEYNHIGIVCADPGSDTYVDYRCDYELWDVESGLFLYLACNETSAVFSNQALRVALTYAIDRDALIQEYYRGFAVSTYLPAAPDSLSYDSVLAGQYGYAPGRFSQAMAEAALEAPAITVLVNKADSRRVKVAGGIGKMLEAFGFTVTVSALSGNDYTKALKNGNFDLHLGQTRLSPNMDLTPFFDPNGTLSYGGLADTVGFALAQGALENEGNFGPLYRRILDDGMLIPLLFRSYAIYVQRGLFEELTPARDHIFYYDLGRTLTDARLEN